MDIKNLKNIKNLHVALVYDRVNKWGGAERVLLALHKIFPNAPLYTSVYNKEKAPWAKVFDVRTSFLQNFPYASSSHELYALLMPFAFESFSFDEFDLVISVTSEAAKGIITKPGTFHLCYCLTPTRYLWSGYNDYFKNPVLRFLSKLAVMYLRAWDKIASQRPDSFIAISKEVQKRIKKYYERESIVIYPSVEIVANAQFKDKKKLNANLLDARRLPYFLIVSRLVGYKKIDLAVKAFNKLGFPLKIIGTGVQANKLKKRAKANIEFLGNLTDEELISYYENCIALVFPGEEDFGLTVLEAQSFGKPVIAFKAGGAIETVIEGKTGEFFHKQDSNYLIEILKKFDRNNYKMEESIKNAQNFSYERFEKEFIDFTKNILN
ncbi:glycosyltransferase family 4 protein [Candidatus Microgenomates bacterium]|nr:MAG: glycosyltransferase family 4 protein [Candidatus Microgenomates bacterium]